MNDLDLVPTSELVDELISRCDHGVIGLFHSRKYGETVDLTVKKYWKGNEHTCLGLCTDIQNEILKILSIKRI